MNLYGADNRAVAIDPSSAARAVKTAKFEKFTHHETLRRIGLEVFGQHRSGRDQHNDHNRVPCIHTASPYHRPAFLVIVTSCVLTQANLFSQSMKRRAITFLIKG